jgi:hypothetical protein
MGVASGRGVQTKPKRDADKRGRTWSFFSLCFPLKSVLVRVRLHFGGGIVDKGGVAKRVSERNQ